MGTPPARRPRTASSRLKALGSGAIEGLQINPNCNFVELGDFNELQAKKLRNRFSQSARGLSTYPIVKIIGANPTLVNLLFAKNCGTKAFVEQAQILTR
jgi:hypothetical protein